MVAARITDHGGYFQSGFCHRRLGVLAKPGIQTDPKAILFRKIDRHSSVVSFRTGILRKMPLRIQAWESKLLNLIRLLKLVNIQID